MKNKLQAKTKANSRNAGQRRGWHHRIVRHIDPDSAHEMVMLLFKAWNSLNRISDSLKELTQSVQQYASPHR